MLCLTLETPWTIAHQAPLSLGFPKQEYWSGLPLPSPEHLPGPRTELRSPALQADSLQTELPRNSHNEDISILRKDFERKTYECLLGKSKTN